MRLEVPEFKRFCFCLPLRYGLLVWAYFMLIKTLTGLVRFVCAVATVFIFMTPILLLLAVVIVIVLTTDIGFSIMFIVGAHKKNYKLLKVYYYYAITAMTFYTLGSIIYSGWKIYDYDTRVRTDETETARQKEFLISFLKTIVEECLNIGCQIYTILLIRSEIKKLKNTCNFEYVNNATEAEGECRLVMKTEGTQQTA